MKNLMKRLNICFVVALVTVLFPSTSISQEENSRYNGIWHFAEYGETLEIKGDSVFIYQENRGKLLKRQYTKAVIDDNFLILKSPNVPFGGITTYQILLSDNILSLLENHSSSVYY